MEQIKLQRYRASMADWLNENCFNRIVTLTFNRAASVEHAYCALKQWHARVDRSFLGNKWQKKSPDRRMFSIFFMENDNATRHWHGLVRSIGDEHFDEYAHSHWKEIVPYGGSHVDGYRADGKWTHYIMKRLGHDEMMKEFVLSTQFIGS